MMNAEFYGVIGGKKLKPTKTTTVDEKTGKESNFMRFTMWCEDMTKKPVEDQKTKRFQRPRHQVQVILPDNARGKKIFEWLEPGRHVFVKGRFTNNPVHKDGETYTNDKCFMADLTFLDSPRNKQMAKALADMVSAGILTEELSKAHLKTMESFYAGNMEGREEPRLYIKENRSNINHETYEDPDMPDFA